MPITVILLKGDFIMYVLKAIISRKNIIQKIANDWINSISIDLLQDFAIIIMTPAFLDDILELSDEKNFPYFKDFQSFSLPVAHLIQSYSFHTQLAYIEIDYSTPSWNKCYGVFIENKNIGKHPLCGRDGINHILQKIGVQKMQYNDEIDSLHLEHYWKFSKYIKK